MDVETEVRKEAKTYLQLCCMGAAMYNHLPPSLPQIVRTGRPRSRDQLAPYARESVYQGSGTPQQ